MGDPYFELLVRGLASPNFRATALERHMTAIDRKRILVFSMESVYQGMKIRRKYPYDARFDLGSRRSRAGLANVAPGGRIRRRQVCEC